MEQPSQSPNPPLSPDPEIAKLQAAVSDLQIRVSKLEHGVSFAPPALPADDRDRNESRLGLTTINRIGAVTLAIGIIFFFKYAADNQWIGAGGLVLAGLLAGALLIGVGEWLRRRQQHAISQGVAGCGCAILYISTYATFGYYKLIPREAGFVGLLAVSALAIALCFRFASTAVAAVGFIGAFIAPLLVRHHDDTTGPWLYVPYLVLLSIVSVATITRLYRTLAQNTALYLAPFNAFWVLLCAWILVDEHYPRAFALSALLCAAVHFSAASRVRLNSLRLLPVFYLVGHASFCIAALRMLHLWAAANALPENRASFTTDIDSVFLALYGVIVITYGVLQRSVMNRRLGLVLLGIVVVKLYLYDVWLMSSFYRISAFVALGVLLLTASFIYSRLKARGPT
ncbi:MAG: DUF2339 domain-containing protein [Acidobacteriaceae bacterium]|nr:DUF2339 domain-containing protein [Acidobacteriaceae bacterium]